MVIAIIIKAPEYHFTKMADDENYQTRLDQDNQLQAQLCYDCCKTASPVDSGSPWCTDLARLCAVLTGWETQLNFATAAKEIKRDRPFSPCVKTLASPSLWTAWYCFRPSSVHDIQRPQIPPKFSRIIITSTSICFRWWSSAREENCSTASWREAITAKRMLQTWYGL